MKSDTRSVIYSAATERIMYKETLISAVQCRPVLWQDTNKNFKNRDVTDKKWEEVGQLCGIAGSVAKKKWKNLKDQFRRELKKIPKVQQSTNAIDRKTKWPYFQLMLFQQDFTTSHPIRNTLNHLPIKEEISLVGDELHVDCEEPRAEMEDDVSNTPSFSGRSRSPSEVSFKGSKRKVKEFDAEFFEIPSKIFRAEIDESATINDVYNLRKAQLHENHAVASDLHFFKSLLPFIEPLSGVEKLELRGKIHQVVHDKYKEWLNNQRR